MCFFPHVWFSSHLLFFSTWSEFGKCGDCLKSSPLCRLANRVYIGFIIWVRVSGRCIGQSCLDLSLVLSSTGQGRKIAGLHVTTRRPWWWSRTKVFLSSGNYSLFPCKFLEQNFDCIDPQHGRLVTWLQTKNSCNNFQGGCRELAEVTDSLWQFR